MSTKTLMYIAANATASSGLAVGPPISTSQVLFCNF